MLRRYDISISFAEEDTAIAKQLYTALLRKGYKVFYYKSENNWSKRLHSISKERYFKHTNTGLILYSHNYIRRDKRWTQIERDLLWRGFQMKKIKAVFVIQIGTAQPPKNRIYQTWKNNPEELADNIAEHLNRISYCNPKYILLLLFLIAVAIGIAVFYATSLTIEQP